MMFWCWSWCCSGPGPDLVLKLMLFWSWFWCNKPSWAWLFDDHPSFYVTLANWSWIKPAWPTASVCSLTCYQARTDTLDLWDGRGCSGTLSRDSEHDPPVRGRGEVSSSSHSCSSLSSTFTPHTLMSLHHLSRVVIDHVLLMITCCVYRGNITHPDKMVAASEVWLRNLFRRQAVRWRDDGRSDEVKVEPIRSFFAARQSGERRHRSVQPSVCLALCFSLSVFVASSLCRFGTCCHGNHCLFFGQVVVQFLRPILGSTTPSCTHIQTHPPTPPVLTHTHTHTHTHTPSSSSTPPRLHHTHTHSHTHTLSHLHTCAAGPICLPSHTHTHSSADVPFSAFRFHRRLPRAPLARLSSRRERDSEEDAPWLEEEVEPQADPSPLKWSPSPRGSAVSSCFYHILKPDVVFFKLFYFEIWTSSLSARLLARWSSTG